MVTSTNSTHINCFGDQACIENIFNLSQSRFVFITCASQFSCFQNSYHLSSQSIVNFKCYGYGCYNLGNIHTNYKKLQNTHINLNTCNQCHHINECINNFTIYCNINNSTNSEICPLPSTNIHNDQCGCSALLHNHTSMYNHTPEDIPCSNNILSTEAIFDPIIPPNNNNTDMDSIIWWSLALIAIVLCIFATIIFCIDARFANHRSQTQVQNEKIYAEIENPKKSVSQNNKSIPVHLLRLTDDNDSKYKQKEPQLHIRSLSLNDVEHNEIINDDIFNKNNENPQNDNLNTWNSNDILQWIMNLQNGRFIIYEFDLFNAFSDRLLSGNDLQNITNNDLLSFGIKDKYDRNDLCKEIHSLLAQNIMTDRTETISEPSSIEEKEKKKNGVYNLVLPKKIFSKYCDNGYRLNYKRKSLPEFTMEDIGKHNTKQSCWIIVDKLVLDVTKFVVYHPGKSESIIKYGGTACDKHFSFHSPVAKKLFWKFVIGRVENDSNCKIQ